MGTDFAINLTVAILAVDLVLLILTYLFKLLRRRRRFRLDVHRSELEEQLLSENIDEEKIDPDTLFELYKEMQSSVALPKAQQEHVLKLLLGTHIPHTYMHRLDSRFKLKRIEAAANLRYLYHRDVRNALLVALKKEKNPNVALYMAQALAIQKDKRAIIPLIRLIGRSTTWMAGRFRAILFSYGTLLLPYLLKRLDNSRIYMQRIICEYAWYHPAETLRQYLVNQALSNRPSIRHHALEALVKHFPEELMTEVFESSHKKDVLRAVVSAHASTRDRHHIPPILSYGNRKSLHDHIVKNLSDMTYRNPSILNDVVFLFAKTKSHIKQELLAKVLDSRIDYFLTRIEGPLHGKVVDLIKRLVEVRQTSGIIFFLNRNRDPEVEAAVVKVLRPMVKKHLMLKHEITTYLDTRVVELFSLKTSQKEQPIPVVHKEPPQRLRLALMLILMLLLFPIIILASEFTSLVSLSWAEIGRLYIVRFNYLLAFYSVTINCIYLAILLVSVRGSKIQSRLWKAKDKLFLTTEGLLPSVSIIAPAYNEANNIVESVNSLLNQRYPDFELIVVNDGSKDETLNTLIDYFALEKRDMFVRHRLPTRTMRGIYTNKQIPNLIVVDKVNGGKADSLNLGLNIASKEFFCGIDSDSLLEPDALTRAVSGMIDSSEETIATGGNICPVNGCTVELGSLDSIDLPKKFLARLQSLEYMRAFMSGRVGWAHMNLLLIISGAFGVFNRERTIQTGGYLTKSGKYRKDTVGEDMELVVRLSRFMREAKRPYRVKYAFNANCWTEVPESWHILRKQRDRWHRGLVDILLFHSAMIANPRYGRLGLVGMLYYFVFELVGPFIEAQGLLLVFLSALLGLLNLPIALLLFTSTILLGILVSVSSVMIGELDQELYDSEDVLRLLGMAILENFGIRQYISLWRVSGFFSAMRKNRGWGAQVRKGFDRNVTAPTAGK